MNESLIAIVSALMSAVVAVLAKVIESYFSQKKDSSDSLTALNMKQLDTETVLRDQLMKQLSDSTTRNDKLQAENDIWREKYFELLMKEKKDV